MFLRLLSYLLVGATVLTGADAKQPYACCEQTLSGAAAETAQGLFEHYFGSARHQTREQWDAERRTYYFAFLSRTKSGEPVLQECVWLLSADGMTLRYLTCQKFADGTRADYTERVQQAVAPYLFLKLDSDSAYFSYWVPRPDSRNTIRVVQMRASYSTYAFPFTRDITAEEKTLVGRYLSGSSESMPGQWDAENKVAWESVRTTATDAACVVNGRLEVFSADESQLRLIAVTLDAAGQWKRGVVKEFNRLSDGVYVAVSRSKHKPHAQTLCVCLVEKEPETGRLMRTGMHFYHIPSGRKWQPSFR